MRVRSLYFGLAASASLLAFSLPVMASAADVTAEGAAALIRPITTLFPKSVNDSGFLTAVPDGDHYRLTFDLGKLVAHFAPPGDKPKLDARLDMAVSPPASDGTLAVKRPASDLKISGSMSGKDAGSFDYTVKDYVFDGQFDPALLYFRALNAHASGGSFAAKSKAQTIDGSFGPLDSTASATGNGSAADITALTTVSGFRENIGGEGGPPVTVAAGSARADVAVKGLKLAELLDIIRFSVAHADDKTLKPEDKKALAAMAGKAMPLLTGLAETVKADNVSVITPVATVKIDSVSYNLGMGGFVDDSSVDFGLALKNPQIAGLPQLVAYGDLIPQDVDMAFSIPGLNFATVTKSFLDQADFNKAEPLSKEQSDAIGKMFLKTGRLELNVPHFSARSNVYDISVTGHVSTDVTAKPAKATADFDVTAKDIDKTIKGIQQLAQTIPELNTASFGLMMAKGMARNEPDGSSHWKVEVSDDGVVKINGQVLPH